MSGSLLFRACQSPTRPSTRSKASLPRRRCSKWMPGWRCMFYVCIIDTIEPSICCDRTASSSTFQIPIYLSSPQHNPRKVFNILPNNFGLSNAAKCQPIFSPIFNAPTILGPSTILNAFIVLRSSSDSAACMMVLDTRYDNVRPSCLLANLEGQW
jgi:hypothetical protein